MEHQVYCSLSHSLQ